MKHPCTLRLLFFLSFILMGAAPALYAANAYPPHTGAPKTAPATALALDCPKPDDCAITDNDPDFWNGPDWWSATYLSHDLPEMLIELTATATGGCNGDALHFRYELFLDLDGNGSLETVVDSDNLPPANTVFYDNAKNPNYAGGTARAFDMRTVANPALDRYRFAIVTTLTPTTTKAAVRVNTDGKPTQYALPCLPYGQHKIRWTVRDACGNETSCEQPFSIRDCKKPTVVCKPLSVNLLPTQTVTLWASDFLEYALDNATQPDDLKIAVSHGDTVNIFPTDPATGLPITSLTFTCSNLGGNTVRLWSMDREGNHNFCQVILLVQDNALNCSGGLASSGNIQTEGGAGVSEVFIELQSAHPAFPPTQLPNLTNDKGEYKLPGSVPISGTFMVTPERTDNDLNGVTTLDLAIIQKHILGVASLSSPYKMIAADINRSGTITTFDVVELRKLILGVYSTFQNNYSWRFIPKSYVFSDPTAPFTKPFPESVTVADVQLKKGDFVAIKIGDVNSTAIPSLNAPTADNRSAWPEAPFTVQDRSFLPGDVLDVDFLGNSPLSGQQFTLEHPGLQLLGIFPKSGGLGSDNFGQFPARQVLTCSWDSDQNQRPHFSLRFRALEAGTLAKTLRLSDAITPAEAYAPTPNAAQPVLMKPVLRFAPSNQGDVVQLLQNQPNPFRESTNIPFYLPQAGTATLRIFDASGKLLHQQNGQFEKGWHQWTLSQQTLGAQTGLLTYTLETNGTTLSKAMLLNQ